MKSIILKERMRSYKFNPISIPILDLRFNHNNFHKLLKIPKNFLIETMRSNKLKNKEKIFIIY